MLGTEFAAELAATPHGPKREALILDAAIARGGIVAWPMTTIAIAHKGSTVEFWAADDYFAIGEPGDFVRVPVAGSTAQALCDAVGLSMPTSRMVDLIWAAAAAKLAPITLPEIGGKQASPDQLAGGFYVKHSRAIDKQLVGAPSGLVAGCKKDVVIANRLVEPSQNPKAPPIGNRVCIYGWHMQNGQPIQPESVIHELPYADYSHGLRFVGTTVRVDGVDRALASVLTDPELAFALSHVGPMKITRYPGGGGSGGKGGAAGECKGLLSGGACSGNGAVASASFNPNAGAVALVLAATVIGGYVAWRYAA